MDRLRCRMPRPPSRAIATAIRVSVTVSIAALTSGIAMEMLRETLVVVLTWEGMTLLSTGWSRTSSKVRASGANSSIVVGRESEVISHLSPGCSLSYRRSRRRSSPVAWSPALSEVTPSVRRCHESPCFRNPPDDEIPHDDQRQAHVWRPVPLHHGEYGGSNDATNDSIAMGSPQLNRGEQRQWTDEIPGLQRCPESGKDNHDARLQPKRATNTAGHDIDRVTATRCNSA